MTRKLRNQRRMMIGIVAVAIVMAWASSPQSVGDSAASSPPYDFDAFILLGDTPAWIGNEIRYTVYATCAVESRFLSSSGEIMLLLPVGAQTPGQYRVPWDGTVDGSPMVGYYTFELYFGDEYAAKYSLILSPIRQ